MLVPIFVSLSCFYLFISYNRLLVMMKDIISWVAISVGTQNTLSGFLLSTGSSVALRIWPLDEAVRDFLVLCPKLFSHADDHTRSAHLRACLPRNREMDRRRRSGNCLRLKHLNLCVVSDCEDLFADGGTSFRCLCDSHFAHAGIFTMAGRGCRSVIWAEREYVFICRRARATFTLVDISPP